MELPPGPILEVQPKRPGRDVEALDQAEELLVLSPDHETTKRLPTNGQVVGLLLGLAYLHHRPHPLRRLTNLLATMAPQRALRPTPNRSVSPLQLLRPGLTVPLEDQKALAFEGGTLPHLL